MNNYAKCNLLNKLKTKKIGFIGGRVPSELRTRLDEIIKKFRVNDSVMLLDALTALADYVERQGRYEMPVMMVYADDQLQFVAEDQSQYAGKPTHDPVAAELKRIIGLAKQKPTTAPKPPAAGAAKDRNPEA